MNMIFMLIGISIVLALIFLAAFFWAAKTGQNDDTCTPAIRMLFDDDQPAAVEQSPEEDTQVQKTP